MIFFVQEDVCHGVMRRRWGTALFGGETNINAALAARVKALCFMGEGAFGGGNVIRHNCLEEAEPPETDQKSARGMEMGVGHR